MGNFMQMLLDAFKKEGLSFFCFLIFELAVAALLIIIAAGRYPIAM